MILMFWSLMCSLFSRFGHYSQVCCWRPLAFQTVIAYLGCSAIKLIYHDDDKQVKHYPHLFQKLAQHVFKLSYITGRLFSFWCWLVILYMSIGDMLYTSKSIPFFLSWQYSTQFSSVKMETAVKITTIFIFFCVRKFLLKKV